MEPGSPSLQADSLPSEPPGKRDSCTGRWILLLLSYRGSQHSQHKCICFMRGLLSVFLGHRALIPAATEVDERCPQILWQLFPLWIGVCVPSPGIWMAPCHLWSIDYGRSADRLPLSWLWKPWLLHTHSWGTQTPHKRFACSARATMGRALRLERGMGPPPTVPHGASDPAENNPSRIPAPHPGVIPVTPRGSEYCAAEPT